MSEQFNKNTTFSISMQVERLIFLDKHVEKEQITRSKFIQKAISFYIENNHENKPLNNEFKNITQGIEEIKEEIMNLRSAINAP